MDIKKHPIRSLFWIGWALISLAMIGGIIRGLVHRSIQYHVAMGHLEVVEKYLAHGGDVNATNSDALSDGSLILIAVKQNQVPMARLLLAHHPFLGPQGLGQSTPLHRAADANNPEMLKLLLSFGVDPNIRDQNGLTPLDTALYRNAVEAQQILIEKGGFADKYLQSHK